MLSASSRDRGIAMIMVIVILLALVAIATPFTVSMQLQEKTSRMNFTRAQARVLAEGARNYAVSRLYRTHETLEKSGVNPHPFNSPDWDTLEEFEVEMDLEARKDLAGRCEVNLVDPKGFLWHVEVEDEQAKVNLNSTTPWAVGNVLGSAILTEAVSEESGELEVDDTTGFFSDGRPDTVDGYLLLEREVVSYKHIDGNTFTGCERGQLREYFFGEAEKHKNNNLVV
ncbi:MAG: hypothetical protein ACYTFG_21635, partial [Planctomycetota bacterium]